MNLVGGEWERAITPATGEDISTCAIEDCTVV